MDCLHYYATCLRDLVAAGALSPNETARLLGPIIAYGEDAGRMDEDARDVRLNCTDEFMELRRTAVQDDLRRIRERKQEERAHEQRS